MRNLLIFTLILLFMVTTVTSLITCDKTQISQSFKTGETPSNITLSCSNDINSSVTISKTGQYFSIDETSIGQAPSTKNIKVSFSPIAPVGIYFGSILFSGNPNPLPVFLEVKENQQLGCIIDIFPTVLTNIKIKQGEIKTRNIQLTVPTCYPSSVNVQGVALQTDERPLQLGELSIGKLQPGGSILIPIEIDAKEVATGTYSDTLLINLFDITGNKIQISPVSISVTVTSGINPNSDFTLSDLPTCALNAVEMNLNNTYKLSCSNIQPDIQIKPIIDTIYLTGVGVTESAGQYNYDFRAKKTGTSVVKAEFLFKNAAVGTPFEQEIRITDSGNSPIPGTTLEVLFYQGGERKEISNLQTGAVNVLIKDMKTSNIIDKYTLYLNGQVINNSFELISDKLYEIIVDSQGYTSNTFNFTVSAKLIGLTLNPDKTFYIIGDFIEVITDPINSTVLYNGQITTNPIKITSNGNHIIKTIKEGYLPAEKNITVQTVLTIKATSPLPQDWKKGKDIIAELSEGANWRVLRDNTMIANGSENIVKFKIEEDGIYTIEANGNEVYRKKIETKGFFSGWFDWFQWWHGIIGLVFIIALYYIFRSDEEKKNPMVFNLGDSE